MDLNEEERFGDVQSKGKERIATHITVYNRSTKAKKQKRSRQSTKSAKKREAEFSPTPPPPDYKELEPKSQDKLIKQKDGKKSSLE